MHKAYLSLGSNLGDKTEHLKKAVSLIDAHEEIQLIKESSYYETAPVGYTKQDDFINMVVELDTTLSPFQLLDVCQTIEKQLKRKRIIRWGPRTIDLDILLYDDIELNDELLTIPHPRMLERAFVMIPLYEIAPVLVIQNQTIEKIVHDLKNTLSSGDIRIIK